MTGFGSGGFGAGPFGAGVTTGIQVLLDDGTGTYPTDITASTRLPEGISWTRGRSDELSTAQPGTASFTWDNADGSLTPFDVGGLSCDQGVRLKVNGIIRSTQRLSAVPVSWPSGGQEFSVIQATATDGSTALARITLLDAASQESTLDAGLLAYYPMQEDSSAQSTRDTSGNNQPKLKINASSAGSSSFGVELHESNSTGLLDGATGWSVTGGGSISPTLQMQGVLPPITSGIRVTFAMEFFTASASWTLVTFFGARTATISIDVGAQTLTATSFCSSSLTVSTPVSIVTGAQVVTFQADASGQEIWLNGVMLGSNSSAFLTDSFANGTVPSLGDSALTAGVKSTFSRLSIGSNRIASGRVVTLHNAILFDMLGETPAQRLARLLTYSSGQVLAGSLDATGDTILGLAAQSGQTIADAIISTTTADLGQAYIDANGALSSQSGTSTIFADPVILDANWFGEDTQVIVDMFGVVNSATGVSNATGNTVYAQDPASIAAHGLYSADYAWNVSTDDQALDRTNWMVHRYSEPAPRIGELTLDMLTLDSTDLANALTLDIGSWLRITGMPSQTPEGTTLDLAVESVTEAISQTAWTLTLNVAPRSRVASGILDDVAYGLLDSTMILAV